jgi:hypothetical protein
MTNRTLERLVWVCIYAGMFGAGLGIWLIEHHLAVGLTLLLAGAGLIAAGAVLIWLRSRRP